MSIYSVKFAVYGALNGGNENKSQAIPVVAKLQAALDANDGIVNISNDTFPDPSVGNEKHFAAVVSVGGTDQYYACVEGQTIDFAHVIPPDNK